MESLNQLSAHCRAETEHNLRAVAAQYGMSVPQSAPADDVVDMDRVEFLSQLASISTMPLPDFARLVRGQTAVDPRPNKDLYALPTPPNPGLQEIWSQWNEVVQHGVVPRWLPSRPLRQARRPRNHNSIYKHLPQVRRHLRKGQKDGRYLIVKTDLLQQWPEVYLSPVGVVDKVGADGLDVRIIDDYSFPEGSSINDFTDRTNLQQIHYNPPCDIAKRIFYLRREHPNSRILIMLGDVAGAFRHVPVAADHVHMFAFMIEGLLVIDLACGFGWCGSPASYFLPGALINGLYEHGLPQAPLEPPLVGSFWCDDHTCLEVDDGIRCFLADIALRTAMATVLGPAALNERKFTTWGEAGRALGLLWNTRTGEVTIPAEKIAKARCHVNKIISLQSATKTELLHILGSLRHVLTCCPPARSFFQRVQHLASPLPRHGSCRLDTPALEDLKWLRAVLSQPDRFNGISVGQFANVNQPVVHVQMDASNEGLCILEPQLHQFIRVRFTKATRDAFVAEPSTNSINVRELQSAVLAVLHWGPVWSHMHQHPVPVCCWIDNTSAVAWTQRRNSRQPLAQLYNRLLSLAEFQYSIACTAQHVPGELNVMADAGSRAWTSSRASTLRRSLEALGAVLQGHALADLTATKYRSHWEQWCEFSKLMDWSPWLHADSTTANSQLGLFAIYCWRYGWNCDHRGNKYSTIQLKLSSIRWYHRRFLDRVIGSSPSLEILMRGIKRLSDPTRKKLPITPAFLRLLYRRLDLSLPRYRLLWGSVLLAYFFLLRRSEFLRIGSSRHAYCLKAVDAFYPDAQGSPVAYQVAGSVTIGLSGSKNDQFGRGAWRTMHATGDSILCPKLALWHIRKARRELRREEHEYLCADLEAAEVAQELKSLAASIGVRSDNYSTHSLRIGGATALLNGKADSLSIKLLGRWMSCCFEEYPVQAAQATVGLASKMI